MLQERRMYRFLYKDVVSLVNSSVKIRNVKSDRLVFYVQKRLRRD